MHLKYAVLENVKTLLEKGANVHTKNDKVLAFALKQKHFEIADLLKKYMII